MFEMDIVMEPSFLYNGSYINTLLKLQHTVHRKERCFMKNFAYYDKALQILSDG